ncbi:Uncharacterized protein APZ42_028306 [Daphnia magna]|uniref:Uncharacterized protein n=1 Tax=Daphnia magna TaxID=35525 RepID=A0A164QNP6_9CRUS|nr:Uncharacterized protein APZ42_028306 [Daphnia magna]
MQLPGCLNCCRGTKYLATCSSCASSFAYMLLQTRKDVRHFQQISTFFFFFFLLLWGSPLSSCLFHLLPWGQSACVRVGFLVPIAVRKTRSISHLSACRALFDLPDDLPFYPPLSFPTTTAVSFVSLSHSFHRETQF